MALLRRVMSVASNHVEDVTEKVTQPVNLYPDVDAIIVPEVVVIIPGHPVYQMA